jgi:hypothetical protein
MTAFFETGASWIRAKRKQHPKLLHLCLDLPRGLILNRVDWRGFSGESMSSRQAAILASRAICVLVLFAAFADLTYLPGHILETVHYWRAISTGADPAWNRYWFRYYALLLEANVFRLVVELFFAGLFYACGDRIARFLLGGESTASPVS